jgi:hypothetical protein
MFKFGVPSQHVAGGTDTVHDIWTLHPPDIKHHSHAAHRDYAQFNQKRDFFWCTLASLNTAFLYFFVSLYPFLSTHCRCGGHSYTWSHSVTYIHSVGLPWTNDQPTQRPLPDNTQH